MAKRARRRVIVLESDDDDEGEEDVRLPARDSRSLPDASPQTRVESEINSKRKLQKLEISQQKKVQESLQQPTVTRLFEAGRKSSSKKNASRGTLPVEVITKPAANSRESSKSRKRRAPGKTEDLQKANLKHEVDHRLWVDKYTPKSVGELVVHTKKVAEVKDWLEGQLLVPYGSHAGSRVLVLTGPPGVGKTAVVHVLAEVLDIELFEWTTPVPELWQEYSHHAASASGKELPQSMPDPNFEDFVIYVWLFAASGGQYVSKLDEFEAFLERRKMSSLPILRVDPTSQKVRPFSGDDRVMSATKLAKFVVIDDLPIVNGREHKERLAKSLFHLALSRDFPTLVVVTEEFGTGVRLGEGDHQHKDVLETLERGGAKKIAFNPVTVNAMKKLLTKVQLLEKCRLSSESISAIAESSAGDIRQALTSLQFLCLGCQSNNLHHLMWDPGGLGLSQSVHATTLGTNSSAGVGGGRDYSLSLFHALGKFLHNKRLTDDQNQLGTGMTSQVKEEFRRYPLDMEEPEVVLSQAHTDPATLLAFLHENVLQFIEEDATDDVAAVSTYLSDTDYLLGAQGSFRSRNTFIDSNDVDPSQVATVVASSVAARGVLFGNGHPAPRRWQSLRAPALWQVERQSKLNKMEISSQGVDGIFNARAQSAIVRSMESYPVFQHLNRHCPSSSTSNRFPAFNSVGVEDPMHLAGQASDLQFQYEKGMKEEHFALETTLMKMGVEDDIEDPDY